MDCALFEHGAAGAAAFIHCTDPGEPLWRTAIGILTPLIVLFSAGVAWRSLRNTRLIARQRATLDLIEKVESTPHYRALAEAFDTVRRTGRFLSMNDPRTDDDRLLRKNILDYMGHYELVAIGIRCGILDETIYKRWMRSHVVMEWNAAADFIQSERWRLSTDGADLVYHPELFEHFQWAASRWSPKARRLTATSTPKPAVPTGPVAPGDLALPGGTSIEGRSG